MIQYKGGIENAESNLRKNPSTESNKIDADTMSNIVEEDDKSSYEDLEEITDDNFDELSRTEDVILSDGDDDDEEEEEQEEKKKLIGRKRKQFKKLMVSRNNKIFLIPFIM